MRVHESARTPVFAVFVTLLLIAVFAGVSPAPATAQVLRSNTTYEPKTRIPTDVWLDGEILLYPDRAEARLGAVPYTTVVAPVHKIFTGDGGLRLDFRSNDDYAKNGYRLDWVKVEQDGQTVFFDGFDTLDASRWSVTGYDQESYGLPGAVLYDASYATASVSGGIASLKPTRYRGGAILYSKSRIVTKVPARVTFRILYPGDTNRAMHYQLHSDSYYDAAGRALENWGQPNVIFLPGTTHGAYWSKYLSVTYPDLPPVADAGPDRVVAAGESVSFGPGSSHDPDGSIVSYLWDFGDGTTASTASKTRTYSVPGTYTVKLTVKDNVGQTGSDTATVTVNDPNRPPVLWLSAPALEADEGSPLLGEGLVSDPNGDAVSLSASSGTVTNNGDGTWSWFAPTFDGPDTDQVTITASDGNGGIAMATFQTHVRNVAPTVTTPDDATIDEAGTFSGTGSFTDPGADSWTATVDYGDGSEPQALELTADKTFALSHTYADNGEYTVTVTVVDDDGGVGTDTTIVTVKNVAPKLGLISAKVAPVHNNRAVDASVGFTDPGVLDTHTALWAWGDGTTSEGTITETDGSGTVSGSHAYQTAGIYTVTATVTDKDGDSDAASYSYVVVYDPSAGFVTGGGWLSSPAGAYLPDPAATGKATFGFGAKYAKGAEVPSGNTEFQLHAAKMNFKSTSYEWLVVAGSKAQYKGEGTIDGTGSYGFMLVVKDGSRDTVRIKIWDKATGAVVYDNQMGASDVADPASTLGGGSIAIHH